MSNMNERRLVEVEWQGPLTRVEVKALRGENDYGIYQVYGDHVVFGAGALLYVGLAADQTFAERLTQHEAWLADENDVTFRVGRLKAGQYKEDPAGLGGEWEDWKLLLKSVEELTIYWHSPPYNSQHINSYNGMPLRVTCWSNRGRLLPEYSSYENRKMRPE